MALLMKESNDILSSVYRATPNLFHRFMPHMQPNNPHHLYNHHLMNINQSNLLPIHIPLKQEDDFSDEEEEAQQNLFSHNNQQNNTNSSPALSPSGNDSSIDQNCTPPSSSSSINSTVTSVSPLDFNSFVTTAASSTPVMSPLMMPTPKVSFV